MKKINLWNKTILHIDMDAFFAAIEQREDKKLLGKPICIGSKPPSRGVICTCSYEARKYGIHSAMPVSIAYRKCRDAIFIKPRMELYSKISKEIFMLIKELVPEIHQVSIDEAYIDLTGLIPLYDSYEDIAWMIKEKIKEKFNLNCSVGMGVNKLIAKIASDYDKPNGFYVVYPGKEEEFFLNLECRKIPGVGKMAQEKLCLIGINTVGELWDCEYKVINHYFSNNLDHIYFKKILKPQNKPLKEISKNKSISSETTFDTDIPLNGDIFYFIRILSKDMIYKLVDKDLLTDVISIKIRDKDFKTYQKQKKIDYDSLDYDYLIKELNTLFNELIKKIKNKKIRLVGVKFGNLKKNQERLFNNKNEDLQKIVHDINKRFKKNIINKGIIDE